MNRDKNVLEHILKYCNLLEMTVARHGDNFEIFVSDFDYKNSLMVCITQIGELVNRLTPEFRIETADKINWVAIKNTRNICVHQYEVVNLDVLWEIKNTDIPTLKSFCEAEIAIR